jgi:hypothetical protein
VVVGGVADASEVHAVSIFRLNPEDGDTKHLRKIDNIVHNHML